MQEDREEASYSVPYGRPAGWSPMYQYYLNTLIDETHHGDNIYNDQPRDHFKWSKPGLSTVNNARGMPMPRFPPRPLPRAFQRFPPQLHMPPRMTRPTSFHPRSTQSLPSSYWKFQHTYEWALFFIH